MKCMKSQSPALGLILFHFPSYASSIPHLKGLHTHTCRNPSSRIEAHPQCPTPCHQPLLGHTWWQGMCIRELISSCEDRLLGREPYNVTPNPLRWKTCCPILQDHCRQVDHCSLLAPLRTAQLSHPRSCLFQGHPIFNDWLMRDYTGLPNLAQF